MSDVVISAHELPPWSYGGTTFTVRYFYNQGFLEDVGRWTPGGDGQSGFYFEDTGTIDGDGLLHVPDSTIRSPLGGRQPNALCSAQLFDENGTGRDFLFTDWTIPQTTPTTFAALEIVNEGGTLANILGYILSVPQILQVQALINVAIGLLNKASAVIYGLVRLSVAPASAIDPVAVADNDRRVGYAYNVKSTAIGAVGDGVTNDRGALHTLANTTLQITGAGGDIYFPPGDYSIQSNLTFPANVRLIFDPRARLKPSNGVTITDLTLDHSGWGNSQKFTNALAGQGAISFAGNPSPPEMNVLWWGVNTTPGTTDFTAPIQAAFNATAGRGGAYIPQGDYLITSSLTLPLLSGTTTSSLFTVCGDGPFRTNLINKAAASNPTILVNRDYVRIHDISIWGSNTFVNDGIKITGAAGSLGRIYIDHNLIFANGNGIYMEHCQSVWVQNNLGSAMGGTRPASSISFSYSGTDAFVKIVSGGDANHIVIEDNLSEDYRYKVYMFGDAIDITIRGNQFEGGFAGIYMEGVSDGIKDFIITGNYLGEGYTGGFAIELNTCRYGQIGPNHIHFAVSSGFTAQLSTLKMTNVLGTTGVGTFGTVWLAGGSSEGLVFNGGLINRFIDESSDKIYGMVNVGNDDLAGIPNFTYNMRLGNSEWRNANTSFTTYPGARLGDKVWKTTPTAGASPGWICTTAAATGALTHTTGTGPSPVVLGDYYQPVAHDFRITITTGGARGTAVYKVDYAVTPGSGIWVNMVSNVTTTEVPRVINEVLGPAITIRWPSATYINGDVWTLSAVQAPFWSPMPALL